MTNTAFQLYVATCITHNRPINRAFLMSEIGADGEELESLIHCAASNYVMQKHGCTVVCQPQAFRDVPIVICKSHCNCKRTGEADALRHESRCRMYQTARQRLIRERRRGVTL